MILGCAAGTNTENDGLSTKAVELCTKLIDFDAKHDGFGPCLA